MTETYKDAIIRMLKDNCYYLMLPTLILSIGVMGIFHAETLFEEDFPSFPIEDETYSGEAIKNPKPIDIARLFSNTVLGMRPITFHMDMSHFINWLMEQPVRDYTEFCENDFKAFFDAEIILEKWNEFADLKG